MGAVYKVRWGTQSQGKPFSQRNSEAYWEGGQKSEAKRQRGEIVLKMCNAGNGDLPWDYVGDEKLRGRREWAPENPIGGTREIT